MRTLGIELTASQLHFVVLQTGAGGSRIMDSGRLLLSDTRDTKALAAFRGAVATLLTGCAPDRVAIKAKPERGQMRAGAAALKMEALLLAETTCDVDFVSGARINSTVTINNELAKYLQIALLTALAGARSR